MFIIANKQLNKSLIIVLLILVTSLAWLYFLTYFQNNKDEIFIALDDITYELAIPYRMMQMNLLEPVDELPVPVYNIQLLQIADTWGAARDEGRTHEGTDIFALHGTPVFSATDGYVSRVNIGSRGGRNVMITGPGGLRYYYAHFERIADGIKRGVPVTTDSVLGFVGNSGNATGTPPHLHFGIYPQRWEAVNPYEFLVGRDW